MKDFDKMSGTEKAAALMVALGPERAAAVLKCLDEKTVEAVSLEIARTGSLSPSEQEDLIGEFLLSMKKMDSGEGGQDSARKILDRAFGSYEADMIIKKVSARDLEKEFDFFSEASSDILLKILEKETPQMMAVILSYLPAAKSAEIIRALPKERSKAIALRMAKLDSVSPEAVLDLVTRLRKNYKKLLEQEENLSSKNGASSLSDILSQMTTAEEQKIMRNLDLSVPEISKMIREQTADFGSVLSMSNNDIRILIDEINDDDIIALALKGTEDEIRFRFLRNMSRNRAEDVLQRIQALGAVRKTDAEDAREEITGILRMLYERGVINLHRPGEQYVV